MLSRLVLSSTPMLSMSMARNSIQKIPLRNQAFRQFSRDGRDTFTRAERIAERKTLRERLMAPAGPNGKTEIARDLCAEQFFHGNFVFGFQLLRLEKERWQQVPLSESVHFASMAWE